MEKKQNVPALRFPGFSGEWKRSLLKEVTKRVIVGLATSVTPYYRTSGTPILRNLNIKENYLDDRDILFLDKDYAARQTGKQIHTGDVLTVHTGYIGTSCIAPQKYDGCLTFTTLITTTNDEELRGEFLSQYLNTPMGLQNVQMVTTQGGRQNLNTGDFVQVKVPYPSLKEQIQLEKFLRGIDQVIWKRQHKIQKLQQFRQAMLAKLFPREGAMEPELRFRGFSGKWTKRSLKEISMKSSKRNADRQYTETFTNSAEFGVISQRDFFDHDISNAENTGNYYVVENDDFVYNPRISTTAPVGPINRNRLGRTGIMSPLYMVFKTHDVDRTYLEWFFKTTVWHSFMRLNGDTGARADRFSIKEDLFFEMPIPCPSLEEQKRIGKFFDQLDSYIALQQKKLEQMQRLKAALLEKLFV